MTNSTLNRLFAETLIDRCADLADDAAHAHFEGNDMLADELSERLEVLEERFRAILGEPSLREAV